MRRKPPRWIEKYRVTDGEMESDASSRNNGAFRMDDLFIIVSDGDGWDHISVSRQDRIPSWEDLERVKRTFFRDDETAMQLHVPPAEHIDSCKYCLHLWRPQNSDIPRPPASMVG